MKTTIIKYAICFTCIICGLFYSFAFKNEHVTAEPVAGTWRLLTFYPKQKDTFLYKETIFFEIEKEGMTFGFLGCNKFRTECKTSGDNIHFGTISTSRKFCNRQYMDTEDYMKDLLGAITNYKLVDDHLYLYVGTKKCAALKKE